MGEIDFSKGGYGGGTDEELFKFFTVSYMEYWWHFREVLRASHQVAPWWKQSGSKSILDDSCQRELVALSLINYAVHTSMFEAYLFFDQMNLELNRQVSPLKIFEVRRLWKAAYSSLYTGLSALSNIIYVLLSKKSVWKNNNRRNYSVGETITLAQTEDKDLASLLQQCNVRLDIRNHLDHYWTIWLSIQQDQFYMDGNFSKGKVLLRPENELSLTINAQKKLEVDIFYLAHNYNVIYKKCSIEDGCLDQYLAAKGWAVDYSSYGEPHNGQRPKP